MSKPVYTEIEIERERQDRIWGDGHDQTHTSNDWVAMLAKHIGKVVHFPWTPERFRYQMIVVAALAVAAIEWCDQTKRPV